MVKIILRIGPPPRVQIRTEKRMNHAVTLIAGLHRYNFDLDKTLDYLKTKVGGSGAVENLEAKAGPQLMLQGFWDAKMVDLFVEEFCIPISAIENTAAGKKKDMRQKDKNKATGRINVIRG